MPSSRRWSRRQYLASGVAVGIGGVAGCISDDDAGTGAWTEFTVEDVRTGDTVSFDAVETPVIVPTFAVWCLTCASQHGEFRSLLGSVDVDVTVIDLNVDPNEDADTVANHVEAAGFDWVFAVAPSALTEALVADFGTAVTSPPSSPVIVRCPDGTVDTLTKVAPAGTIATHVREHC